MKFWVTFFAVIVVTLVGTIVYILSKGVDEDEARAEALSIYINRPKNQEAFNACLNNSNNNRDVVYNDSNEVVNSCRDYADRLYPVTSQGTIVWHNAVERELNRITIEANKQPK